MRKKKIIIDSDAGADDLLSLKLAVSAKNLDILGIIAGYGVSTRSESIARIQKYINLPSKKNYPVIKGSSKPIKGSFIHPKHNTFRKIILDRFRLPSIFRNEFDQKKILKIISNNSIDTYVSIGPLSNLSRIINHKAFNNNVKKIVIMGGSLFHQGNFTPFSEVNFYIDSYAVKKVFNTDKEIYLFPLDITDTVQITKSRLCKYFDNDMMSDIFIPYLNFYKELDTYHLSTPHLNPLRYKGAAIHDCLPIISLIDPKVFKFDKMEIFTDKILSGKGHIYPSLRKFFFVPPKSSKIVNVATSINKDRFWKVFDLLLN